MISGFATALYSHFAGGGDFPDAASGGLYYVRAPQGTAFPYAVFQFLPMVDQSTFSTSILDSELQIRVFSATASPAECWDMMAKAQAFFDTILTPAGGVPVRLVFSRALPPMKTDNVEGATWEGNIYFEIIVQQ